MLRLYCCKTGGGEHQYERQFHTVGGAVSESGVLCLPEDDGRLFRGGGFGTGDFYFCIQTSGGI